MDQFLGPAPPDNGAHGELVRIGRTRRAQARTRGDQWGEPGIGGETLVDGVRVRIEVEQPAQPLDGVGRSRGSVRCSRASSQPPR